MSNVKNHGFSSEFIEIYQQILNSVRIAENPNLGYTFLMDLALKKSCSKPFSSPPLSLSPTGFYMNGFIIF